MRSERVRFAGALGAELAARLDQPDAAVEPQAWALFAHCFTCSKDLKALARLSRALVERGFGVLRFDFTGLGESEGEFAATDFSSNLADLVAAAEFLRRAGRGPQLLVGHSLGGAAVLATAARIPAVEAVAVLGAPSSTDHLRRVLLRRAPEIEAAGEAEVELAGRRFRVRKQLLADLERQEMEAAIAALGRPLLVFHSPDDEVVEVEEGHRIFAAARHPKSFVALPGADHLLLRDPADAGYAGAVLAAWAGRYVPGLERQEGSPLGHGEVLVVGGPSGYAQEIAAGPHLLRADEPREVGGTDSGPSPYDLLLAALGACTSMTLRMYADRKRWPLAGADVLLTHGKIHARDCADCETKEGMLDRIERRIHLLGELDDEQRQRLLEIANRCPVHRTLTSEVQVVSRLVQ
jgi:putative redox protein